MKRIVGDPHNFGLRASIEEKKVIKPRTLFWEALFLSNKSDFRIFLEKIFLSENLSSPFSLAPRLKFHLDTNYEGAVDLAEVLEIDESIVLSENDMKNLGAMLGLCFWFGIGDLHVENMVTGYKDSKLICFPIDIECIFDSVTHIKQTLLVPSEHVDREKFGLANIFNKILSSTEGKKMSLINSFFSTVDCLNWNANDVVEYLKKIENIMEQPIRVVVRDTKFYVDATERREVNNLLLSERLQALRGDIPYFFRFPGEEEIRYFIKPGLHEAANIELDQFQLTRPRNLLKDESHKFVKLKTALMSIRYLAEKMSINSYQESLSAVELSLENSRVTYKEQNNRIVCVDHCSGNRSSDA